MTWECQLFLSRMGWVAKDIIGKDRGFLGARGLTLVALSLVLTTRHCHSS